MSRVILRSQQCEVITKSGTRGYPVGAAIGSLLSKIGRNSFYTNSGGVQPLCLLVFDIAPDLLTVCLRQIFQVLSTAMILTFRK
jgi:hypothetical protein